MNTGPAWKTTERPRLESTEGDVIVSRYKTREENYRDCLPELRKLTVTELYEELRFYRAFHPWYLDALRQVLTERGENTDAATL